MKVKHDFVTNSSSTSFIIGDTRKSKNNLMAKIEVDLSDFITNEMWTKEDVISTLYDHGYDEDSEEVQRALHIIERGGAVYILNASSEGDSEIEKYLCYGGLDEAVMPEGVEIILGEGGY